MTKRYDCYLLFRVEEAGSRADSSIHDTSMQWLDMKLEHVNQLEHHLLGGIQSLNREQAAELAGK